MVTKNAHVEKTIDLAKDLVCHPIQNTAVVHASQWGVAAQETASIKVVTTTATMQRKIQVPKILPTIKTRVADVEEDKLEMTQSTFRVAMPNVNRNVLVWKKGDCVQKIVCELIVTTHAGKNVAQVIPTQEK